jgi:hypothetical protein
MRREMPTPLVGPLTLDYEKFCKFVDLHPQEREHRGGMWPRERNTVSKSFFEFVQRIMLAP